MVEKDKAVNKDFQELLTFLREMTINYAAILALNSDMFPSTLPDGNQTKSEGIELSAHRLISLFQSSGFSAGFMGELNSQVKAMDEDSFNQIYEQIFKEIRLKFLNEYTILDAQATSMLDILAAILGDSDELKEQFIKMRPQGGAWIPGPNGINLEKGIGSCTGDLLENNSVLGPFL